MTSEVTAAALGATLAEARGVGVRFGTRAVLEDVDLAVHAGEIVAVIGPNGSGKTTLLRVLLGLIPAATGRVWRRPGLRLGYMPQRLAVDPTLPLTVGRFLALGGGGGRRRRADILAEVGAGHLEKSPIQGLSGGEMQRVLLARALLRAPELLVLDEPVQGVDISGQSELYALIAAVRDHRGCGVLLVSHDLHLVMAATDSVVCLNHHVCCTGHPEAVSRNPAYLSLFGAESTDRLAVYRHHHDHGHDAAGGVMPLVDREGNGDDAGSVGDG